MDRRINPRRKSNESTLMYVLLGLMVLLILGVAVTGVILFYQIKQSNPALPPAAVIQPVQDGEPSAEVAATRAGQEATPAPNATRTPNRTTEPLVIPAATEEPTAEPAAAQTDDGLPDDWWMDLPVLPRVSEKAIAIYAEGIDRGNNPTRFSKIGDCQSIRQYFIGIFDDPVTYKLGQFVYLESAIDNFHGSFDRKSLAVKTGWNVASVLTVINADPEACDLNETPLECEFRLWNPSITIVSMETWPEDRPTSYYENYLRRIVEFNIQRGVLPILATKADNLEGDHSINRAIARVAREYDVPLWNFWRAVQPLPNRGLLEDGFHLTHNNNNFADSEVLESAWPVRNLTALMALDTVWRKVNNMQPSQADW